MDVVLLERVEKLGQMGDVVTVKPGFARNYLLAKGKALRATKENLKRFELERAQLEARNLELKKEAEAVAEKLNGQAFTLIRQAGDSGQLYGSVSSRDVADAATEGGFSLARGQVILDRPIKTLGLHEIGIRLHPEVRVDVTVNVARTPDEAELQARGESIFDRDEDDEDGDLDAEEFFEDEADAAEAQAETETAIDQAESEGEEPSGDVDETTAKS